MRTIRVKILKAIVWACRAYQPGAFLDLDPRDAEILQRVGLVTADFMGTRH